MRGVKGACLKERKHATLHFLIRESPFRQCRVVFLWEMHPQKSPRLPLTSLPYRETINTENRTSKRHIKGDNP